MDEIRRKNKKTTRRKADVTFRIRRNTRHKRISRLGAFSSPRSPPVVLSFSSPNGRGAHLVLGFLPRMCIQNPDRHIFFAISKKNTQNCTELHHFAS